MSRKHFKRNLLGYVYTTVGKEEMEVLCSTPEVLEMSCYPDENSIKGIDGKVVVRLNDGLE